MAYNETLKVPLILYSPGAFPSGRLVEPRVQLADLAPSIAEAFQLVPGNDLNGESFVGLLEGEVSADHQVYFEGMAGHELKGWAPLTGLITGRFKLIATSQPELYDLETDPGETDNRIEQERDVFRDLEGQLSRMLLGTRPTAPERELSSEDRRQLLALGYLGSTAEAVAGVVLDPKQGIVIDMAIRRGRTLLKMGDIEGARSELKFAMAAVPGAEVADFYLLQGEIEDAAGNRRSAMKALRKGVERFPALEHLRFQLATYLLAVDELDEAELVARQVLAANPRASQAYNLLGAAALRRGDPVQALSQFRSGLAVEPESIPLKLKIVDLLVETGEFQEAVHLYDELIHRGVLDRDGDRLFKAAMLHGRMGDLEGAVALFRRGLEVSPEPVHHLSLAVLLAQGGRTGEAVVELQIAVAGELSDDQRSLAESLLARLRQ